MFHTLSHSIKNTLIKQIYHSCQYGKAYLGQPFSSSAMNGFIMIHKKEGQTVEELHDKLKNKLNIHSLQLIEDLDPAYEGLVSFACGNSKRALPYLDMLNCYNLSLVAENSVLPRRDFVKAMSNFIGNSRQKYLVQLDNKDPSSYIIYSTPISINDILIKRMSSSSSTEIDLLVRCNQGCDISTLIHDISFTLKQNTQKDYHLQLHSCLRTQHCGIKDSSPLCIDSDDIDSIEYVHSSIPPYFFINNSTILQHYSVAYFKDLYSFREFKKQHVLSSESTSLEYYEHWSEDGFIPIHPIQNLQVLLVTPPKKIATPIKQGRKFKTEIHPAMLEGIGHFCMDNNEGEEKLVLKPDVFFSPSPMNLVNLEKAKSAHYFHKAHKSHKL